MTTDSPLAPLLRGWYVVALGLIATGAFLAHLTADRPLYYAKSEITLSAQGAGTEQAIAFAQAVESVVNDGKPITRFVSPDAPLHGTGVRDGYSVVLPDTGGQWQTRYERPVLSVEVVAESPDRILATYAEVVSRVEAAVTYLQREQDVPPETLIVSSTVDEPTVTYVGTTRSGKARVLVSGLLVGVGATFAAAYIWDQRRTRSRTRTGMTPTIGG